MASPEIIAACDRVLAELMGLKRGLEAVAEDSGHRLHNPILVTAVADGMEPPASTGTQRCFARVDTNEPLRTEFVRPLRAAIDALGEVAQQSEATVANTRCIWATWAATYALYNHSFTLYEHIKTDDIEFTCVYLMARGEEEHMCSFATAFGGQETMFNMGGFEAWVLEEAHEPLSTQLDLEDESVAGWVEGLGSEFEWPMW
tara:strand:- start:303 stop:908 length:606 start_codon:yes stop_codon:yes gene_type:complete